MDYVKQLFDSSTIKLLVIVCTSTLALSAQLFKIHSEIEEKVSKPVLEDFVIKLGKANKTLDVPNLSEIESYHEKK